MDVLLDTICQVCYGLVMPNAKTKPISGYSKFGARLTKLLAQRGWSMMDFLGELERVGVLVNLTTIYRWTRGNNRPPLHTLIKLSEMFSVSLDHISGRDIPAE